MERRVIPVESYEYSTIEDFQSYISQNRKPLIIKKFDIGPCRDKWSLDYLKKTVGKMDVRVHLSPTGEMNFLHKNFIYKTMPFEEFLCRSSSSKLNSLKPIISENEVLYLRAIGTDRRGKNVANFKQDFPQISEDINFPDLFDKNKFFSSIFRIASAGVQIWTHYDVMDNALIQITGTKRVVLFSPDDAQYLYLNGDKSEVIDVINPNLKLYPEFIKATLHECVLDPGDILYIPSFWFHNVLCETFSVGINVFWKHLDTEMYDKHDVYGNRDLVPAAKALEHINKAVNSIKSIPEEYRIFYLHRYIGEIKKVYDQHYSDLPKQIISVQKDN